MNVGQAAILALMVGLLVWSPALTAGQDPRSVYAGTWSDAITDLRIEHGPLANLEPTQSLLVVAPRITYTEAEATRFQHFLEAGGRALVVDDDGSARSLLSRVPADIEAATVFSTSYAKNPAWPILARPEGGEVILSRPHAIAGDGEVLLAAHPFSWKDLDNDLEPDLGEPNGPWPVAMRFAIGRGELTVVGDGELFVQDVGQEFAAEMLAWLDERQVVIDEGHRATTDPVGTLPMLSGAAPLRAAVAAALVVVATLAWAVGLRLRRRTPTPAPQTTRRSEALDELADPS